MEQARAKEQEEVEQLLVTPSEVVGSGVHQAGDSAQ